jgi:hypothetical protein
MFSHFCLNFAKTGIVTHILVNILVANVLKPTIFCLIRDMQMDVHCKFSLRMRQNKGIRDKRGGR